MATAIAAAEVITMDGVEAITTDGDIIAIDKNPRSLRGRIQEKAAKVGGFFFAVIRIGDAFGMRTPVRRFANAP